MHHFPHLNLAVEEEQCVLKYRAKPLTCEAGVVVMEWCKRCPKPDARSRDRPSSKTEQAEGVIAGNVAAAVEAREILRKSRLRDEQRRSGYGGIA